ncbi:hypothetical protein FKM82_029227 [Ascaphus truei]
MCVKEVEILGHISIDWDYSFEEFTRPPSVEENILHICVKDHGLFQKKDSPHQESHKRIALLDRGTAQVSHACALQAGGFEMTARS